VSRPIALAAGVAFVAALVVAYALSSAGSAEAPAAPLGTRAVPLDVDASASAGTAIVKPHAVPALARPPKPARKPATTTTTTETETETAPTTVEEPSPPAPEPVAPAPAPVPAPAPPAPEPAPPVEFDDSG
jgi:hypothetical protein